MISVAEAKRLIIENCNPAKEVTVPLLEANGCILAEQVNSVIDTPPFNQSAMDGFAFSYESWNKKSDLIVKGEVQTGNISNTLLKPGEAIRIYTGAALPSGADTVVMQEKISRSGNTITILDQNLIKGNNVRLKGAQTKKGEVVLKPGQLLTPAGISFLAGIGIHKVKIYSKPSVSIIVTGKELTKAGNELLNGKIYESNSIGLEAALHQLNIKHISVDMVEDEEEIIKKTILGRLKSDIIILTGGVSVGDYDLVPVALEKCGVEKIFHMVKQKPGKPFYFGKHSQSLVFALPGNPAAVMSCFYEYIVAAISSFTKIIYYKRKSLPLANDFHKKSGLTNFLKGKTGDNNVSILENQESFSLNSFAVADCLIELGEEIEEIKKGTSVNILMII